MYGSLRFKAGLCEEVDKFIEAAEKHATMLTANKDTIICPYKDCKNYKDIIICPCKVPSPHYSYFWP